MKKLPILKPGGSKFVPLGTNFVAQADDLEDDDGAEDLPVTHLPPFQPLVLWEDMEEADSKVRHKVEVVPELASKLRPHQREGVAFLFECTMGLRGFGGQGCILADDMGLGKTLMSITLLWTLMNQGLKHGESACRKVVVACPTSLVGNWDNEIRRWIGERCVTFPVKGDSKSTIRSFLNHRGKGVLIISYDQQRLNCKLFDPTKLRMGPGAAQTVCDLLICDEAHKLKNADSAIARSLNMLPARKRVLLSGTPMQNDLEEFFNMVNFCNPDVFGTVSEFKRKYERPILKSREPDASDAERTRAAVLQKQLSTIVNEFILKRGNILNAQHLPPKLVQYVCCRLTAEQEQMYDALIENKAINLIVAGKEEGTLSYIRNMIKICCHPKLIHEAYLEKCREGKKDDVLERVARMYSDSLPAFAVRDNKNRRQDANYRPGLVAGKAAGGVGHGDEVDPERSGKLLVLFRMMQTMRAEKKGDRIVIVSNYTSVLELIEAMCVAHKWPILRLDGSTSGVNRTKMVEQFNDPMTSCFAFLLSSKAGGCGINLIGGNRLVLFDADWNPANDKQAAGRIWREGQNKRCFIYRFMSTGSIEEKIIQRQLSKESLQNIVEDTESFAVIPQAELKNLFARQEGTPSDTHDTLRCKRCASVRCVEAREIIEQRRRLTPEQHVVCTEFLTNFTQVLCQAARNNGDREFPTEDLDSLAMQLANGQFNTLPEFSKRLRALFVALDREQAEGGDAAALPINFSVNAEFIERWAHVVPKLTSLQAKVVKEGVKHAKAAKTPVGVTGEADENDEVEDSDDGCVDQDGCPDDTDLKNWSHHVSVGTCDDDLLKRAMADDETISFVFGLEVNWDLLQAKEAAEQEEKDIRKEQQRLDLQELNEQRDRERRKSDSKSEGGEAQGEGNDGMGGGLKSKKKNSKLLDAGDAKPQKKALKTANSDEEQIQDAGPGNVDGNGRRERFKREVKEQKPKKTGRMPIDDDNKLASKENEQPQMPPKKSVTINLSSDEEDGECKVEGEDDPAESDFDEDNEQEGADFLVDGRRKEAVPSPGKSVSVINSRSIDGGHEALPTCRSSVEADEDVDSDYGRRRKQVSTPQSAMSSPDDSSDGKEDTWTCKGCTYENDAAMFQYECGMCAEPSGKKRSSSRAADSDQTKKAVKKK